MHCTVGVASSDCDSACSRTIGRTVARTCSVSVVIEDCNIAVSTFLEK